jgi:hypothetical protein
MAQKIGIRQNAIQVIISGARVPFDPRSTEQVEKTRDPNNYKANEQSWRKAKWEARQAEQRALRRQAAE